jgi:EAL domain-containing protein (putative c-di-GMP-specific phosphodiesterase class I)/CheY-like chemotaxis protein
MCIDGPALGSTMVTLRQRRYLLAMESGDRLHFGDSSVIDIHLKGFKPLQFGAQRLPPRVCVIDGKPHIRKFLAETLEDIGFVAHQCGERSVLPDALTSFGPDLLILGLLIPESDVTQVLRQLGSSRFSGKVMLFGGRASPVLLALQDLGEQLGLAMLPPLRTPFRDSDLHEALAEFLPIPPTPSLPVDVDEALRNKWLEVWYQPKIDLRRMKVRGAEALVRMRHPTLGVVPPAFFIPNDNDPQCRRLSEFVLDRAIADWTYFAQAKSVIEMTIHLPLAVLQHSDFADRMYLQLPDHSAFARLLVELDSLDIGRDPALARQVARQLDIYNIGVSIGDVSSEPTWAGVGDFPVAELQMEGALISECGSDRERQVACGTVLGLAERLGAQTVAKNIESTMDFRAARDLGFDLGQGFIFAKPMDVHKFVRTVLQQPRSS